MNMNRNLDMSYLDLLFQVITWHTDIIRNKMLATIAMIWSYRIN